MAHTPGPWEIVNTNHGYMISPPEPGYLAKVQWFKSDEGEIVANALLIAASPNLLKACEAARDWLALYAEHNPTADGSETELGMMLDAAIAKAREQ